MSLRQRTSSALPTGFIGALTTMQYLILGPLVSAFWIWPLSRFRSNDLGARREPRCRRARVASYGCSIPPGGSRRPVVAPARRYAPCQP